MIISLICTSIHKRKVYEKKFQLFLPWYDLLYLCVPAIGSSCTCSVTFYWNIARPRSSVTVLELARQGPVSLVRLFTLDSFAKKSLHGCETNVLLIQFFSLNFILCSYLFLEECYRLSLCSLFIQRGFKIGSTCRTCCDLKHPTSFSKEKLKTHKERSLQTL